MTQPAELTSIEEFLFGAPLYKEYKLPEDKEILQCLYGRADDPRVDGHCPNCNRASTFTVHGQSIPSGDPWNRISARHAFDAMSIRCTRNTDHRVLYHFLINKMIVQKVGQFPSLADIANDEIVQYRKVMSRADAQEFHKAIGLAAHGVGIGSFVYLRRVFERLVNSRYQEFRTTEGWKDEDFYRLRMNEKIELLKDHLPDFLVKNSRIYSILSIGLHALEEEDCLGYFELMKQSIIYILEDDKKKKEELSLRAKFSNAIARFVPNAAESEVDVE
jgi:hypothetical protein